MNLIKSQILLLFIFLGLQSNCQILFDASAGINWSFLISSPQYGSGGGSYQSYPSNSYSLEVKGRRSKVIHLGFSAIYYRSNFNWLYESEGHYPNGQDALFKMDWLRISIFPEFSFGKTFQVFFNISPFISFLINSSKSGYTTYYQKINNLEYVKVQTPIYGTANDDFHDLDFGFQSSLGITYYIVKWFGITIKESCSLSLLNANKKYSSNGYVKNASLNILLGATFLISEKTKKLN